MYKKHDDLLSKTNQRNQRTYYNYNYKLKKTAWEMSWKNVSKCKKIMLWTLGHEISFILKTKGHHENILLSMILPRACYGPPTPAAASHETSHYAATPHDSTQNQETWSVYPAPSIAVVCALMLSYLNSGDQKFWQHCVHYLYSCCHDLTVKVRDFIFYL